ncbi:SET domain-containing protein-lysine N-methyltransferase [Sediminibacterium sp.]|uniref:SET domain-containing protein-lysine N-methyltransferase n=1 Tax=Sediminibacterium sp. TaxID=1917865 RepID=UPI0025E08375|nr:SET domain-containing protein-lysine N-methyltransferase [Sediminibacterium sp.]MBW0176972.1 SET domain-containing protein-lysine N-methyltransferase [Sediminibacterium sp.]
MIPLPLVIPETPKIAKTDFAKVFRNPATGHHSLHAAAFFDTGDLICSFSAQETYTTPSYLTLQTGLHKHISLSPDCLQYTNHSCDPNVFFDTDKMELIALRSIQPDDELVFFYPSTEWQMASPFSCNCGSVKCLGTIAGAAALRQDQLNTYRLTSFILLQIENR